MEKEREVPDIKIRRVKNCNSYKFMMLVGLMKERRIFEYDGLTLRTRRIDLELNLKMGMRV